MRAHGRKVALRAVRAVRRAFDVKRQSARIAFGLLFGAATPLAMVMACADDNVRTPSVGGGDNAAGGPGIPDPCRTPNEGCACDDDGAQAECGQVREQHDDYVTCSMGTRTCVDGEWSACATDRVTVKSTGTGSPGLGTRALGSAQVCPKDAGVELDPCDPYCNVTPDTPGGFDAGPGFSNTDAGLTLIATGDGGVPCSEITLTASTNTVTVTSFGPPFVQSPTGPVTFTLTSGPPGCVTPSPFPTTWTVDKVDRATVAGTDNTNGSLTIGVPLAGVVRVTAYALGDSDFEDITVKVNVVEAPTTTTTHVPNGPADSASPYPAINSFSTMANACAPTVTDACRNSPNVPATASTASWLYPYQNTYFPLGLPAPWVQYAYSTTGGGAGTVKVSLRYPVNLSATAAGTLFNYSLIVLEQNSVTSGPTPIYGGLSANTFDPQVVIPEIAWDYFEQSARGANADLLVQRRQGGGTLETELRRPIRFVDGQLKGTVYYNSYSSPQGGNTGAILSIAPGANSPELAVQPGGACTVCHSVSVSGRRLITNTESGPGTGPNQSRRYDMTNPGLFPSPTVLDSYATVTPDPVGPGSGLYQANQAGDRFTWGGAWTDNDATLYMTHGGRQFGPAGGGDPNFRAPPDYSNLRSVTTPGTIIPVSGWPNNVSAVTPRFSPDGTKLAFGHWGGNALNQSPSGTLASAPRGTRLTVVDFTCASPPCTASTANNYFTAGNARDLTPNVNEKVAWPSFTPSGDAVLYQRQYRTSKSRDAAVHQAGSVGPSIGITGAPVEPGVGRITMDIAGARGTARFDWTYGSFSGTNVMTAATPVALGATGLFADFSTGTYVVGGNPTEYNWDYSATVQTGGGPVATFTGTPVNPGFGLVTVTTGGAVGTAVFSWTFTGSTGGTGVTTATSVLLTGTGLTMVFAPGTYVVGTTYAVEFGVLGAPPWKGWPGWSPSHINSTGGALAEIWMSNVPANGGTAATPTRLFALNGLSGAGTSYLPQVSRLVSPPFSYHTDNSSFTIAQADNCNNTGTASAVSDYRLNYMPAANPTESGGMVWVVFTSRRMFGNVAFDDPWDAEPWMSCSPSSNGYSGIPPTKKLWVAAVDKNFTPGSDPSHPAFYLPGQELRAGNSNGYWVNSPCGNVNATCTSHDDCCLATGTSPTRECKITSLTPLTRSCQNISACSMANAACTTTADCCPNLGLTCPAGGGVCITVPPPPSTIYQSETTSREYVASCPHGTQVKWRFFEWQATIPADTTIQFSVQTKNAMADMYQPMAPLVLSTATSMNTLSPTTWYRGPNTVDQVLAAAMPALASGNYLRVTMTFNPTMTVAPTLLQWRQIFDCVPAE